MESETLIENKSDVKKVSKTENITSRLKEMVLDNKTLTLGIVILSVILFMAIFADFIAPYGFAERLDNCGSAYPGCRYSPPSMEHWMGTNRLGRDVFARIIYGSRTSLQMAVAATILALLIGIPLGVISGYFGGAVDKLLNTIADSIYAFPSLLLAILISIALTSYGNLKVIIAVSVSVAVVYVPVYFKIIRAQVLKIKNESYIDAAKSMGASSWTIIFRYVLPNVLAAPIALIPFNMIEAILTNAGLAFLGLGIQPPTPDWGYDVYDNKSISRIRNRPWLIFWPGFFIFLLAFSFSLIGDSLNDKFNPLITGDESDE